jgi:hypothetical protein
MKTSLKSVLILMVALPLAAAIGCGRTAEGGNSGSGGDGKVGEGGAPGHGGAQSPGGSGGSHTGGTISPIAPRVPAFHRAEAASCVGVHSPSEPNPAYVSSEGLCMHHADCTQGVNGRCVSGIGYAANRYYCVYDTCATDADCDVGKVCHCDASTPARCLSVGDCRVDADCGSGSRSYCSPSMGADCSGSHTVDSYRCHTEADSCIDDSDCTGGDYCDFNDYSGRWVCTAKNMTCAIG